MRNSIHSTEGPAKQRKHDKILACLSICEIVCHNSAFKSIAARQEAETYIGVRAQLFKRVTKGRERGWRRRWW